MKRTLTHGAATLLAMLALGIGAAQAKTLVYCSEGSPENFTPALNTTGTSFDAARPVYNQLVEFERGSTNVVPGLAEKYDISPDGQTITFKLRKGVKFHSGVNGFKPTRDLNADDVLFSFNRQWKADHPYHKISGGAYDYFSDMDMPTLLKSVEKVDDLTVKMVLTEPNVTILANLAMDFASIHSAEYADFLLKAGKPEQFDQVPVGTGPFSFVAYQKDAVIRYKAFPDYWGGKAKVDDLVYAITGDATSRYAKLKKGECHVMFGPNPADLEALAIDKAAILKDVYQGAGQAAKNMIPPTIWSYNDKVVDFPYDPAKAKEMLVKAGVTLPMKVDLWYMPKQRPYNPNGKRIGEMMQADLAKIGVEATLVTYEWGEYRKRMQAGEHTTGQLGWTGDNGDPDNFFFLLGCSAARDGGQNLSKWCNKEFDDRLSAAKKLTDKAARTKLYEEMQVIAKDDAPQFTIAHSVVFEATTKNVTDYKISPFGRHEFYGVGLE